MSFFANRSSRRAARLGPALAAASALALGGAAAQAADADSIPSWVWDGATGCGETFEGGFSIGAHCLADRLGSVVADEAAHLVGEQGRALFGENFRFVHRLSWSPFGEGVAGNLDAVIPLSFAAGRSAEGVQQNALFLQQGLTRWRDGEGFRRNDLRYGTAYRFALSDEPGADVLGFSTLLQENLERGHQRLATGLDYAGRWGSGWLQHFTPMTDWLPGRPGYEERPLGGTELGFRLDVTTTLSADAALARWEDDGAGRESLESRFGLGWRPHPWLGLRTGWASGLSGESVTARLGVNVPLGGAPKAAPRWEGLGTLGVAADTPADMWRPVENVERLRTVERVLSPAAQARAGAIAVAFLQDEVASGGDVEVEVSIPAALSADLRLVLRLAPGSGDDPAVAGEDFVDEPVEVTIARGETRAEATVRLLHNAELRSPRTLAIGVSLASETALAN